jgi:pimeloyl-ACP methyl ester carboxylesterase
VLTGTMVDMDSELDAFTPLFPRADRSNHRANHHPAVAASAPARRTTTIPQRRHAHSRDDATLSASRGWRAWGRRRRIAPLTVGVLAAALIAVNTLSVLRETAEASGEQIVRLPSGDVHVVQSGPPSAPAVVLLHGTAGSTAWWDPVAPALRNWHVVRVDLLGHGRSAKPGGGYHVAEQARTVVAVLDNLGVRRATVVGHSTGGMVATSLAEQRRDLVTAIALIDTGPRADAYIGDSLISRLLPVPVVGQLVWRLRTDNTIRGALGTVFTRDVRVPDQIIADVRGMTYRSFTATYQASLAFLRERPVPDRLAKLGLPVLVIFGSRDRRWEPSSVEDYRRVPQARITLLDVGHTPMFEDPDTTGALLGGFAKHNASR